VLQFLSEYNTNPRIKSLLDKINLYYMPFLNPGKFQNKISDGFKYTERNRFNLIIIKQNVEKK
jgi:murein tripeptide amidase MpaA